MTMHQTINITKQFASQYDTITLYMHNDDKYVLDLKDVADISCVATKEGNCCECVGGTITFLPSANDAKESEVAFAVANGCDLPEWNNTLLQRLQMWCDVDAFALSKKDGYIMVQVQFDPLMDDFDEVKEYSNCASFEYANNCITLCFGDKSKQPKRKDNNYHEIVQNWADVFGDYIVDELFVRIKSMTFFSSRQNGKNDTLKLGVSVEAKQFAKQPFEFLFGGIADYNCAPWGFANSSNPVRMSKMADGKIYVSLDLGNVEFVCDTICVKKG